MRRLITLSLMLTATLAFGLAQQFTNRPVRVDHYEERVPHLDVIGQQSQNPVSADPIGTVSSSAVTSIKIGEASNPYTYLLLETNQLASKVGMGTNGGVLGFIHRQNTQNCSGINGLYRYTVSVDGGQTWRVASNTTVPPEAPAGTCWGLGPISADPNNGGRPARYPNFGIFSLSNSTSLDSLAAVYSGPILRPAGTGWDGYTCGVVTDINDNFQVTDEQRLFLDDGSGAMTQYFCHSMVQQHPDSNVWYFLSRDFDPNGGAAGDGAAGRQVLLNRGVFDNASRSMTWTTTHTWSFNWKTTVDPDVPNGIFPGPLMMAFAPDGQKGYVAFQSDLANQGQDTIIAAIFIETTDGGRTWGAPFEFDMGAFPQLADSLRRKDTIFANGVPVLIDTSVNTGKATQWSDADLEVDKNGNPHLLTIVGGASITSDNRAGYSLFGSRYYMFDLTKDQFGDWNMLYIGRQNTLRAWFGDIQNFTTADAENFQVSYHPQVSRSADGSKIFFSWTDTDTSINPLVFGPNDANGNQTVMSNYAPNLQTRVLDLDTYRMTPQVNWTETDNVWASQVIMPRTANIALQNGNEWVLPTMTMTLDGASALDQVSFHYFTDVKFTAADFTDTARYFYNCKENPYANTVNVNDATCGQADGSATIQVSGGISPYTYAWTDQNNTTAVTANNLPAGIYSVTVTDAFGCEDVQQVIVNDQGAASLSIDGASVNDPNCFNTTDGTATVTATGGTGTLTYLWSPSGETTAAATSLPGGTSTVTVTDGNGCTSRATVTLSTPPSINLTASATDITCFGDGDGSATAIATGGSGTLTYEWNGNTNLNTSTITGLAAGSYTVEVTDANGCSTDMMVSVSEPDQLEVDTFFVSPPINGRYRVQAVAAGGTVNTNQDYAYSWEEIGGPYTAAGPVIFNRPAGCYQVSVTDLNGCVTVDTVAVGVPFSACTTTSIDDEIAAGIATFRVYPNPASQVAYVGISLDRVEAATVELLDLAGKRLRQRNTNGREINVRMELDNLAAGVYLVRVSTNRGSAVRKLVIR